MGDQCGAHSLNARDMDAIAIVAMLVIAFLVGHTIGATSNKKKRKPVDEEALKTIAEGQRIDFACRLLGIND